MIYTVSIPDSLAPGITASREATNAALPATIADPDHQGEGEAAQTPGPDLYETDDAYLSAVLAPVADSYCRQFLVGPYASTTAEAAALLPDGFVIAPPEPTMEVVQTGVAALKRNLGISHEQGEQLVRALYGMLVSSDGVVRKV